MICIDSIIIGIATVIRRIQFISSVSIFWTIVSSIVIFFGIFLVYRWLWNVIGFAQKWLMTKTFLYIDANKKWERKDFFFEHLEPFFFIFTNNKILKNVDKKIFFTYFFCLHSMLLNSTYKARIHIHLWWLESYVKLLTLIEIVNVWQRLLNNKYKHQVLT